MLHKVEIKPLDDLRQEIKIDGQNIRCVGYNLHCYVDEIPMIELEIPAYLAEFVSIPMEVRIKNLREIAKMMDYENLKEFVEIWCDLHDVTTLLEFERN